MQFNSIQFAIFFICVLFCLFIFPKKCRILLLLAFSYYFYMCWSPVYALLMLFSTFVTFITGIIIDKANQYAGKKSTMLKMRAMVGGIGINLLILFIFKYANFSINTINSLAGFLGREGIKIYVDLLLPVGISFYTFQAIGYTIDVYRGEIDAEKNFLRYALFVSFFPQLVAGPIERSKNLLSQIRKYENIELLDLGRMKDGLLLLLWGLFQKIVIADRISPLVNLVYNNISEYGFVEIAIATVLFSFQIYCDFGGYTDIARGAAQMMGFSLIKNFRQPYLAKGIIDFWRRWHISLTSWFTEYLYIPLGGNRRGLLCKYRNILFVFLVSGLWHGASWNFVFWGLIHACFQIIEDLGKRLFSIKKSGKVLGIFGTYLIVCFAWIFFAADSFSHAIRVIKAMFSGFSNSSIYELGLDKPNWIILIIALIVLIIVDLLHEKNISVFSIVDRQGLIFRYCIYGGLIWSLILFGVYGAGYDASQFIYFQF